MGILQQRGIKLVKKTVNGYTFKTAKTDDWDMVHIKAFTDTKILEEIIQNLDLAIAGHYDQINDTGLTNKYDDIAFIEPNGIEYWDQDAQNKYPFTCSLEDFRALCIEWLNFLKGR
ncbi:hypothetical protein ASG31_00795 [Chryseobacterium sp. Leaf404]|uniref:hypothetical protein n=1 Tax=unclassified Chryseobacterium TaxID=2593645 RepID=UPI0006FB8BC6|nr:MULTISPECIES: hypothetical protein [unclassified Chryseobacterium]KQT21914.1 hypothetical protein ASG31_00795 [Chryseobacterium sp. Leaf404]